VRTGIVLAGGRSARFGADKLIEPIDGDALLDRAIGAVLAVTDEVIVAGRAVDGASASIRGLPDAQVLGGPLLALRTALRAAGGTTSLVVGGDMPDLVVEVLRSMLVRLDNDPSIEAVILTPPDGQPDQPLHVLPMAARTSPAAAASEAAVADGRRSLRSLLDRLNWIELPASDWLPLDPDARTLLDVDTRVDLERIRAGNRR
jgi:molybdopterin-guanine dinucleotide biosynthesis protein A